MENNNKVNRLAPFEKEEDILQNEGCTSVSISLKEKPWVEKVVYIFEEDKIVCGEFKGALPVFEKFVSEVYKKEVDTLREYLFIISFLKDIRSKNIDYKKNGNK